MSFIPALSGFWHDAALLLLAWFLGALVGAQREAQGRAAGLRTHTLVCGAACLLTLVSQNNEADKGRIAAQIVSGVGFLGAGVILRKGVSVRGLTTAATIWTSAALGIAVGFGERMAALAVFATLLVLATLTLAKGLETRLRQSAPREVILSVTVGRGKGQVAKVLAAITDSGAFVTGFESEIAELPEPDEAKAGSISKPVQTLRIVLRLDHGVAQTDVAAALADALPGLPFDWDA